MTCSGNCCPRFSRFTYWIVVLALACFPELVLAQGLRHAKDSIRKSVFVITPRINSAGHFPFSGALLNKNANVDLNIFYERSLVGFFIFKSQDMEDKHSIVNYLQPGIFKKFQLTPKLKLGTFLGYVFSQTTGFRDKDSDYFTAAVVYWTISERLKMENTSLFFDLSQSEKLANRFLLSYWLNNFKVDLYVWHRVVFEEHFHATSASLAVNFPKVKISENLSMQTTFSYLGYLTKAKPDFAMRQGFLFTIAFPLTL